MKKILFIGLFSLLSVLSARAYDFEVGGIYYNLISGTDHVEVTSSSVGTDNEYSGSVDIPATVTYNGKTYTVTSIGDEAFGYCRGLTSVTIPNSVTSIGAEAFEECDGLTSVTIPNSVTSIGKSAFFYCDGLTSVTIPEGVTSIGNYAFCGCSGLTSVTIPESVTSIGMMAFRYTLISSPLYNSRIFAYMPTNYKGEYAVPSGIQTIAGGAFYECRDLTSVTIPDGVTDIKAMAFLFCNALSSITLPESLETISLGAFYECVSLVSVTSLATTPPRIDRDDQDDTDVETVFYVYSGTLYVPRGCKAAYDTAQEWHKFAKIEETSGVGTATVKVQVNDTTMGSVIGGGEWDYALNEQVTLVAVPYPGYYFVKWDDGKTSNPRILTVEGDLTLTAILAKLGGTTANEDALSAAPFAYVQGRMAYLSDGLGEVEAFTLTGQRVYRGFDRTVTLPRPGVYVLRVVADGRRCKVAVK